MAQYLLSVHDDGSPVPAPDVLQEMFAAVEAFNQKVQASGAWVFAGGLQPLETATTVDGTQGEVILTDGPFSEAKEQIGGFWVVDVADLDAAIALAAEGSAACRGKVEVRPFQDESGPDF